MKRIYVQMIFCMLLAACGQQKAETEKPEEHEEEANSVTLTEAQVQQAGIITAPVKNNLSIQY